MVAIIFSPTVLVGLSEEKRLYIVILGSESRGREKRVGG